MHNESSKNRYIIFNTERIRLRYEMPVKHRAIGVVYNPRREKFSNYVPSVMSQRYDAFIFLDETTALHPFHLQPNDQQIPDTYPFGF